MSFSFGMPEEDGARFDFENVPPTLSEVLARYGTEVVKEARQQRTLARYLAEPAVLTQVIQTALTPFSAEECKMLREWGVLSKVLPADWAWWLVPLLGREQEVKNAYICAEIIAADNMDIVDALLSNAPLLTELFRFIDMPAVSSHLAVHLTDCIHRLLMNGPESFMAFWYMAAECNVLPGDPRTHVRRLARSVVHPPFGDLLGALLGGTLTKQDNHLPPTVPEWWAARAEWWLSQDLFGEVIGLFAPGGAPEGVIDGFRFLSDLLRRHAVCTRLAVYVQDMVKPHHTARILEYMFAAERQANNALVFQEGAAYIALLVQVAKTVARISCGQSPEADQLAAAYDGIVRPVIDRLPDFTRVLASPGPLAPVRVTWQAAPLDPPLGLSRSRVGDILAAVARGGRAADYDALAGSGAVKTLLGLCREYHMNSSIHCALLNVVDTYVEVLSQQAPAAGDGGGDNDENSSFGGPRRAGPARTPPVIYGQARFQHSDPRDAQDFPNTATDAFLAHLLGECAVVEYLVAGWREVLAASKHAMGNKGLLVALACALIRLSTPAEKDSDTDAAPLEGALADLKAALEAAGLPALMQPLIGVISPDLASGDDALPDWPKDDSKFFVASPSEEGLQDFSLACGKQNGQAEQESWIEQAATKSEDADSDDASSKYSVKLTAVSRYHLDAEKEQGRGEDAEGQDSGFASFWTNDFGDDITNLMSVERPEEPSDEALTFDSLAALLPEGPAGQADQQPPSLLPLDHAAPPAASKYAAAPEPTPEAAPPKEPGFNSFNFWRLPVDDAGLE
eukprot:TRINITY_DN19405_c0_g1_i1.p1 TRINITY_DN19405_c0_g1~~TRINITY_DN19405_c0_g1_i1.p1  ORF type:complete len:795 (+),score=246.59 TRINITY_DN19405_c0_g1_i1:148-2532(+)